MRVVNIHERRLKADASAVGALLDGLSSKSDALWPHDAWPRMRLDRPLGVGAAGGHGPIRYEAVAYAAGKHLKFRFLAPRGFDGWHGFDVVPVGPGETILRHTLEMTARGPAALTWPLVFRPLHDALVEDGLSRAEAFLGSAPSQPRWSIWVRALRLAIAGRRAAPQTRYPGAGASGVPVS